MSVGAVVLPIVTVQPDFGSVISDVRQALVSDEAFWLSCYKAGETSVHGKVLATLDDVDRDLVRLEGRDGVGMEHHNETVFAARCSALNIPRTRLAVPTKCYTDLSSNPRRATKITAFDVAPDGSQFAVGYHDGSVSIHSASSPSAPPTICKPHLSTVTALRFFPSSRVLLTTGNDFSVTILPAELPDPFAASAPPAPAPARTFRGHARAVTSAAIVSRGRNLLSGSKDSTLRLWDAPSGEQIRMMTTAAPILSLSLGTGAASISAAADGTLDPREVDTADKLAFCALQDGTFEQVDLRTKTRVFRSTAGTGASALNTIAYAAEHSLLATGSASGLISIYDVRVLGAPLTTFRRNSASVEDVAFVDLGRSAFALPHLEVNGTVPHTNGDIAEVGLAIATEDGLPYIASVHPHAPSVRAELVGTDCDPVRTVRVVQGEHLWTAADDGVVRQYRV
ncbi:hypothetical protein IEO21_08277 [Rhodonia placenta]|uniref:WD40 repeat-like protein n=1 Tax=Rhodonia placenta TaxID=104341 RepID=A0A8H7NX02_9APHY|nr:hypothetical protein IEO21_08277 [Postia placenta]